MTTRKALEYAMAAWPHEDSDEEVSGGDMVEWFYSEFLPMARKAVDAESTNDKMRAAILREAMMWVRIKDDPQYINIDSSRLEIAVAAYEVFLGHQINEARKRRLRELNDELNKDTNW